ncbi:MAG: hypothetical protein R3D00_10955 [Bacteroidia bacterium]
MRNPRIEQMIPKAIEVLQSEVANGGTTIPDKFKGYFASFGAAVVQSGLLPAVIFYGQKENQKEGGKANTGPQEARWKVTWCIYRLIFPDKKVETDKHAALKNYLLGKTNQLTEAEEMNILDAALALKMALRTFELTPSKKENP